MVGPASSGRTSVAWAALAAATRRGESVALIDTFDRFDPPTAHACGIDLSQLLWVRGQAVSKTSGAIDPAWLPGVRAVNGPGTFIERVIDRAIKSLNLVVQSGVCTLVVIDLIDRAGHRAAPAAGLDVVPRRARDRRQRYRGVDSRVDAGRAQRRRPLDRDGRIPGKQARPRQRMHRPGKDRQLPA